MLVTPLILTIRLGGRCYYHTHFTAEETEVQRRQRSCPKSHSWPMWEASWIHTQAAWAQSPTRGLLPASHSFCTRAQTQPVSRGCWGTGQVHQLHIHLAQHPHSLKAVTLYLSTSVSHHCCWGHRADKMNRSGVESRGRRWAVACLLGHDLSLIFVPVRLPGRAAEREWSRPQRPRQHGKVPPEGLCPPEP